MATNVLSRALTALCAVALTALGILSVVEVVASWLGSGPVLVDHPSWVERLRSTRWDDPSVRWVLVAVATIALVLLLAALWPRPPLTIPVGGDERTRLDRRSLEQALGRSLTQVEGVRAARVRVTGGTAKATVDTTVADPAPVRQAAQSALAAQLGRHRLGARPEVRARRVQGVV